MSEEQEVANTEQEATPAKDAKVESSTTEPVESPTKQDVQEVPFHERPEFTEFKARQEEKLKQKYEGEIQRERERADRLEREFLERTRPQQPQDDPYANFDEETRKWYKNDEIRVKKIAGQAAEEMERKLRAEFDIEKKSLYNEYGKLAAKEFLKENPEIKPGSDELRQIVEYARTKGLDLDEARKIVMFDKVQEAVKQKQEQKKKEEIKIKQAANVEVKTVTKNAIPTKSDSLDITMDEFLATAKSMGMDL